MIEIDKDLRSKKDEILKNLEKFYSEVNEKDLRFPDWYAYAFQDCVHIKELVNEKYEIVLEVWHVAQLVAILSPANKWETNKSDVLNVFRDYFEPGQDLSFFTYGNNVYKARMYLKSVLENYREQLELESEFLKTPKILNFYRSILGSGLALCIDRHILTACGIESKKGRFITAKQYEFLTGVIHLFWVTKNKPFQTLPKFQAFIWASVVFLKHGINHYGTK